MSKKAFQWIVDCLPYAQPFLFVDTLSNIDEHGAEGYYTFPSDADFYKGHFKDFPVTPGVLLTECCAQIGLVCLGIYLLGQEAEFKNLKLGMSSSQMEFLQPVLPGETVRVVSNLTYFRFQKLKCEVKMYNESDILVCKGTLAGMISTSHG